MVCMSPTGVYPPRPRLLSSPCCGITFDTACMTTSGLVSSPLSVGKLSVECVLVLAELVALELNSLEGRLVPSLLLSTVT